MTTTFSDPEATPATRAAHHNGETVDLVGVTPELRAEHVPDTLPGRLRLRLGASSPTVAGSGIEPILPEQAGEDKSGVAEQR